MKNIRTKKFLTYLFFSVLALLTVPSRAHAVFGVGDVGLFDVPMMQLDALDFVDNVVMRFLIFTLVLFVQSQIFVLIAGGVLEWAAGLEVPLGSGLVQSGWSFTVGLVNLALVIIFLVVAFSIILRLEAFQARKTLTKLLVVALLMNFSLLFVGMVVDIAQILINTLRDAFGGGFVQAALAPLKVMWAGPVSVAVAALGLKLSLALVPFGNVASAVAIGTLFLADMALMKGWSLQLVVLMVFNFLAGMLFLLFSFLFLARTVVIALLAVVAPLALAAWVLPGTKKYWDQWIHALTSWALVGVVGLFLMALGMRLAGDAIPGSDPFEVKGLSFGELYKTIFLLAYLVVAFIVAKKLTPMGADMIISQFRQAGSKIWEKVGPAALAEIQRKIGPGIESFGRKQRMAAEALAPLPSGKNLVARLGAVRRQGWGGFGKRALGEIGTPLEAWGGQATQRMKARDERKVEEAERKMLGRDSMDLARIFNQKTGVITDRIAAVRAMIKNGDSDDLTEYIYRGILNGASVGQVVNLARERLGPPGYRPMIKALGGMIYTEPERLGRRVQRAQTLTAQEVQQGFTLRNDGVVLDRYGSPVLQDRWWEQTVKQEIIEKLQPAEIVTMDILGNYMKRFYDYSPDPNLPQMSSHWRAGGDAITKRMLAQRGELVGSLARKPGSAQGRQQLGDFIQDTIDTHFGRAPQRTEDLSALSDEEFNSLASAVRVLYGPGARNLGVPITYRGGSSPGPVAQTFATEAARRAAARRGPQQGATGGAGPTQPQPPQPPSTGGYTGGTGPTSSP